MKYLLLSLICLDCAFATDDLKILLDKIDNVYRSKSSTATMLMTIKTPHWTRTLEMKSWTKGLDKTFITIMSPRKEKGISTLKKKNEMWNFFPKVNKVIKVPPSMMMGSWMGSDFTNDDLVKENTFQSAYDSKLLETNGNIVAIELIPKKETITVWGKLILTIDKAKLVPKKQEFYNEKNKLVRKMIFSKVEKIKNRFFPKKMTLMTINKPGHETVVEYQDLKLDAGLSDKYFTMQNLQKRR